MKRIGIGLVALGALAMASAPTSAQDKPGAGLKICLSLDKMNAFREGQLNYWRSAAEDLGVTLVEQVAGEDAQRQSSQVDTCIAQGVNGIISIPWDYEAVLQDIERAHAADIPFITVDQAPAETDTVDFHIGADPHADGLNAGKRLVELVGDKPTKVVDLQGALSHNNGQGRDQGFKEGIKDHPNIQIVSEIPTEWRPEPVVAGMENALQAHPDIGAVFSATDGLLPPVRAALEKVGRFKPVGDPDHVIILSVDGDPQGCAAVKEGWMDAGYAQPVPLMSRRTIEVIIDIAKNGKKPEGDARIQLIPGTEYMKSNIDQTEGEVWGC